MIDMETPPETSVAPTTNAVRMPLGILGFEQIKEFVLISNPGEEPFAWFQVPDNASLAFVVMDPFIAVPEYQPDIPQPDVDFLGLKDAGEALLLAIVTIHGNNRATVNLKGPIVINRRTHVGKQVIIANATEYSVQHPLPVAEKSA